MALAVVLRRDAAVLLEVVREVELVGVPEPRRHLLDRQRGVFQVVSCVLDPVQDPVPLRYQYRYSGDRTFLESKGYPVISRCADFYQAQAVYEVGGGRVIVGKCTDLERLGAGRENAFMTTCGVIATFTAAADAAAVTASRRSSRSASRHTTRGSPPRRAHSCRW
jgi:hypothetical protein